MLIREQFTLVLMALDVQLVRKSLFLQSNMTDISCLAKHIVKGFCDLFLQFMYSTSNIAVFYLVKVNSRRLSFIRAYFVNNLPSYFIYFLTKFCLESVPA